VLFRSDHDGACDHEDLAFDAVSADRDGPPADAPVADLVPGLDPAFVPPAPMAGQRAARAPPPDLRPPDWLRHWDCMCLLL